MKLEHALQILDLIRPGGGGQVVNVKRSPRAIGMMGLAPFEVESSGADDAKLALDNFLEKYPVEKREEIRRDLWRDYHDIQSVREAGVDLSFLDDEFGKID